VGIPVVTGKIEADDHGKWVVSIEQEMESLDRNKT